MERTLTSPQRRDLAQQIEKELATARLAARPSSYRIGVGLDATGDPAVWITLVVDDGDLDRIWGDRDSLREQVEEIVRRVAGNEFWPYVTFQATSEQEA